MLYRRFMLLAGQIPRKCGPSAAVLKAALFRGTIENVNITSIFKVSHYTHVLLIVGIQCTENNKKSEVGGRLIRRSILKI